MKAALQLCVALCALGISMPAFGVGEVIKNGDTLVFMGDSITQFGKDTEAGYLRLVVRGLEANGVRVTWHGAGVSGNTSAQMRARFQRDVIDRKAQVVTILAGVNDCLGGWPQKTASTPDDVAAMADMAIAAGITPVLLSPTGGAVETFPQSLLDYVAAVRDMAKAKGVPYGATHEALRAYVENPVNPAISLIGYPWKACSDGLHMDIVGNRIIAREIMKALGFCSPQEVAKTEAAWNAIPAIVQFHPCVKVTKAEYEAVKAAARREGKSLAAYHADLFARGVEIMKANPAQVKPTDGADITLSVSPYANLVTYDTLLDCGRAMAGHDSLPKVLNYAVLAAIHELPPATEADIAQEPVRAVDDRYSQNRWPSRSRATPGPRRSRTSPWRSASPTARPRCSAMRTWPTHRAAQNSASPTAPGVPCLTKSSAGIRAASRSSGSESRPSPRGRNSPCITAAGPGTSSNRA